MILDEMMLRNFGPYREEQKAILTPLADRPVVLFGALNGSGKTTFMEAMQLALYGRATASRGRLAYHDYLAQCVNRYVPPTEGAGIELAFRYWVDGRLQPIRLKRTWYRSGKAIKENFEVWRSDVLDQVATERWAEFVEEIIPNQIAQLFFFDGEKIESLADPAQSADLLRVGLHSLLGLDLVDHLMRGLGVVERRCKTEQLTAPDRSELEKLDKDIAELDAQRIDLGNRIGEANTQLDLRNNDVGRLEALLERSGGHLFERRKELEAEFSVLTKERERAIEQLLVLASGDAPLLLLGDLCEELEQAVMQAMQATGTAQARTALEERDRETLRKLSAIGVKAKQVEAMRTFLEELRKPSSLGDAEVLLADVSPLNLLSTQIAQATAQTTARHLEDFEQLEGRIHACEQNLGAIPEEDAIRSNLETLSNAKHARDQLTMRSALLEEERSRVAAEIGRKEQQRRVKLEGLAKEQLASSTKVRMVRHSTRARETLGRFRVDIAQKHMLHLETLITQCFSQLHRKKALKHSITIDRASYELQVREEGGHLVETSKLSAGERQLLAVAVLWALAKASGRRLPTVIDTPLGRLDGPHRHFLVDNYFPRASHQVILFSTDEEVTPAYYRRLAPAIGREYSIVFDEGRRSAVICDGYFREAARAA